MHERWLTSVVGSMDVNTGYRSFARGNKLEEELVSVTFCQFLHMDRVEKSILLLKLTRNMRNVSYRQLITSYIQLYNIIL